MPATLFSALDPCARRLVARIRARLTEDLDLAVPKGSEEKFLELCRRQPLDLDDAIAIKDAFGTKLDRAYLAAAADRFGLRRQLENLLGPL